MSVEMMPATDQPPAPATGLVVRPDWKVVSIAECYRAPTDSGVEGPIENMWWNFRFEFLDLEEVSAIRTWLETNTPRGFGWDFLVREPCFKVQSVIHIEAWLEIEDTRLIQRFEDDWIAAGGTVQREPAPNG